MPSFMQWGFTLSIIIKEKKNKQSQFNVVSSHRFLSSPLTRWLRVTAMQQGTEEVPSNKMQSSASPQDHQQLLHTNVRGDEHPGGKIKVPSEIQSVGKGPLYRDGRNQGSEPFKHLEEAARAKPEGDHRTGKLVELRLSGEGNAAGR